MLTEIKFPNQTGSIGFSLNFKPANTTGTWEFGIGSTGNSEMALTFSGHNGRVYDEDGHFICGYGVKDVGLEGILETGHYAYYADGVIAKCKAKEGLDFNYAYFETDNLESPNIRISGGESTFDGKRVLFLSQDEDEDASWIDWFSHFVEDVTVSTSYTGAEVSGRTEEFSEFDLLVFGSSIGTEISGATGIWHLVDSPKLLLGAETAEGFGLLTILGSNSSSIQLNMDSASPIMERKLYTESEWINGFDSTGVIANYIPLAYSIQYDLDDNFFDSFYSGLQPDWNFADSYYLFNTPFGASGMNDTGRQIVLNIIQQLFDGGF